MKGERGREREKGNKRKAEREEKKDNQGRGETLSAR